jgi:hypothetical protein
VRLRKWVVLRGMFDGASSYNQPSDASLVHRVKRWG